MDNLLGILFHKLQITIFETQLPQQKQKHTSRQRGQEVYYSAIMDAIQLDNSM